MKQGSRSIGFSMLIFGTAVLALGMLIDADRRSGADNGAPMFDLTRAPSVLLLAGFAVAILGALLVMFGGALYDGNATSGGKRMARIVAPLAAFALVAGCAAAANDTESASGTDEVAAASPDADTETATAKDEHDHGAKDDSGAQTASDDGHGDHAADGGPGSVIVGTADGSSPCEIALPTPSSPGQVGSGEGGSDESGGHGHRGMVRQKALTAKQQRTLVTQIIEARKVIDEFPTVTEAEAGGYGMSTVFVPCIGAHYTNVARAVAFNPAAPSELLYDGIEPDSKIVGLSYLVWHPGGPPEGFAGENDIWHQHNSNGGLCLKGTVVVGGESMTEADCTKAGGKKRELTDIWMMHAWVAPGWECSWGVFSGECPELGGRVGGNAFSKPTPDDDGRLPEG